MCLPGYDYSQAGMYFVTLVTQNRENLFGEVTKNVISINPIGRVVMESWIWLASQYPYVDLDLWCIMPNHFHGILVINDTTVGAFREPPLQSHWDV